MMLEDQHFADKGIEFLFSSLRSKTHNAKVIATSRIVPILENGERLIDVVEDEKKQHLNGLRTDFAVGYLASNGLDKIGHEKLEELATGVDGHPLALKLLVELVKEYGVADILEDLSIYQDQKENTILKARKLFDKLAGGEKELLERISVYRKPVTMKALKAMFTEETSRDSVSKLLNKSLIETNHNGSYWLHPLIQEFAYNKLKNTMEAHINACRYYIFLPLPEKPSKMEDIQSLVEAHYHACRAGRVDLAARILYHSNLCGQLETWGNFKTIIELCTPLLPCISLEGRIIPLECHEYFLGMLGIAYFRLRFDEEAIIFIEEALKTARLRDDKKGEANQLGNLGLIYHQLGDNRKSIEYYEQVIKIAKEIGDRRGEGKSYGNLGNVFLELGEIDKAITNYKNSVQILKDTGYKKGLGVYLGDLGVLYSQVGKIDEGIDFLGQSLRISKETGDKIEEKNQHMNMGIAYKNAGMLGKSIESYKKALKISIEIEDERGEGDLVGNIGNLFLISGQGREAIEYFEQSLKIDRDTRNKRGESISLASLGASYAILGQLETAIEFYEKALNIAKEVGDIRTESLIQVNMGNACFKLGQIERALDYFEKALSIAKKMRDPAIIEKCENALNSKDNQIA
jgi:tetratricopeptide (TPR) repeat protein